MLHSNHQRRTEAANEPSIRFHSTTSCKEFHSYSICFFRIGYSSTRSIWKMHQISSSERIPEFLSTSVFVTVVPNCSKEELTPIIQGKILEGSVIHTDGWKAYDRLVLNGYDHYRVFHCANEFARGKSHVNGIECFWSFAKRRMSKFNGLADDAFLLHLKECESRVNFKGKDFDAFIQSIFFS